MKLFFNKKGGTPYFLAAVCLLFIMLTNPGCNGCCCSSDCKPKNFVVRHVSTDSGFKPNDSQVLVLHTSATNEYVDQWLDSIGAKYGDINVYLGCRACGDSSLFVLDGAGINAWVQSGTATGGSGGNGKERPQGGDTLYYCRNLTIQVPELNRDSPLNANVKQPPAGNAHTGTTLVGVLDTGIDPALASIIFKSTGPVSCPGPDAGSGWNFINNSKDVTDDYPARHGTVVTQFILDQAAKFTNNDVKILPVKVFDAAGTTNLSVILCGLAYAKDRGAQVINASFGFYARRTNSAVDGIDSAGLLLEKYVEKYLTANHILLVAAAGNTEPYESDVFIPNPNVPATWRNLDSVSFYPASLSRRLPNVIAVTTTYPDNSGQVSPNQNFSPNVVGIGVVGDRFIGPPGSDCVFANPIDNSTASNGSSFATPIAAGKIAAFYPFLAASGGNTLDGVVGALQIKGEITTTSTGVGPTKVKKGASMRK